MDKITHKIRREQWTSIIKECLASGMSKTAWCREHGISDKSFFYWQRRLREDAYKEDIGKYYNMTCQIFEDEHHYVCHDGREL